MTARPFLVRLLAFLMFSSVLLAAGDEAQEMYQAVLQSCRRGRTAQAKAQLETMRRRFPGHPYTLKAELAVIETGRDYYDMIVNLKLFLRENPGWPEADRVLLRIASLYGLHNNYSEAVRTYATLLSNHPSSPFADEARFRMANLLVSRGDLDAAERSYRVLLVSSDRRMRDLAALRLADILAYQRRWSEAVEAYDRIAASEDTEPETRLDALFQAGEAWKAAGKTAAAAERFRRVVDEYPETHLADLARQRLKDLSSPSSGRAERRPAPVPTPLPMSSPFPSPPPRPSRPPSAPETLRPYVQVGAFRDIREANKVRLRLRSDGFDVTLRRRPEKDGYLYRILVGPYRDRVEAVEAAAALRSRYGGDAFVVNEPE